MDKNKKYDFNPDWYAMWMKQSKEFFESAEKNLKDVFANQATPNPEDHFKQMQQWLEMMKNQWQHASFTDSQKMYQDYWQTMSKMYTDASQLLLQEWMKRMQQDQPIKSARELYELWLECCHEIYQASLKNKSFQDAYGEFMNAAFKFWKSTMPK